MLQQVYAQVITNTVGNGAIGAGWTLQNLFTFIFNLVLGAGFSLTLIMLAMGFIRYVMAQGDKAGIEQAQKWVTYAVVGGLGLFLVFAIRSAVERLVGQGNVAVGSGVNI